MFCFFLTAILLLAFQFMLLNACYPFLVWSLAPSFWPLLRCPHACPDVYACLDACPGVFFDVRFDACLNACPNASFIPPILLNAFHR